MPKASPGSDGQVQVLTQRETAMLRALEILTDTDKSLDAVAKELGISRRQLYTWRSDPFFRLAEDRMLSEQEAAAKAKLRAMVEGAIKVLAEALVCDAADRDEAAKWTIRLQAAKAVLDRIGLKPETIREGTSLTDAELDAVAQRIGLRALPPTQEDKH